MVFKPDCCCMFPKNPDNSSKVIPLTACRVTAVVRDSVAQVTLEQTFVNKEDVAIEAVYMFPIVPAGAVNQFGVSLQDGRKFAGVIKKKQEAKAEYDDAVDSGHGAYLLQLTENSEEIFQSSVGNLQPGHQVTITIGYVVVVDTDEEPDSLRFLVPTTIAPRYRPAVTAESGRNQTVDLQYAVSVPYTVSLDLTFETSHKIKSVGSPSHKIDTKLNEGRSVAHVKFVADAEQLDRDIVVVVNGEDLDDPILLVEEYPESDTVCGMVTFVPRFRTVEQKNEVIFLIDTSGSMDGFKVTQAKAALNLMIRSLPIDSYFNVYEFSHNFRSVFESSQKYSQETLATAIAFVQGLEANGGTELLPPLTAIVSSELLKEYKRQIMVLTDGEVGNVQEVLSLARGHSNNTRVFTLGIGNSVSHELVDGLAKAANGTAIYIMEDESFSKKVMQQLERTVQPAFSKLKVEWFTDTAVVVAADEAAASKDSKSNSDLVDFVKNTQDDAKENKQKRDLSHVLKRAPFVSAPIFKGSRYTAFAIGSKATFSCDKAVISGEDEVGNAFRLEVKHDKANPQLTTTGSLLHTVAARKLIEELSGKRSYLHEETDVTEEEVDNVIELISLNYNLVSVKTSFVCIEQRELGDWQKLSARERREVPILGDKHGGDVPRIGNSQVMQQIPFMAMRYMSAPPMMMACAMPRMMACAPNTSVFADIEPMLEAEALCASPCADDAPMEAAPDAAYKQQVEAEPVYDQPAEPPQETDMLQVLLKWQLFDGSFTLTDDFCKFAVSKSEADAMQIVSKVVEADATVGTDWKSRSADDKKVIAATLIALGYLLTELELRKVEWNMIADKATASLNSRLKRQTRAQYESFARKLMADYLNVK